MKGWCSGALAAALMLFSGCELMIESDHGRDRHQSPHPDRQRGDYHARALTGSPHGEPALRGVWKRLTNPRTGAHDECATAIEPPGDRPA